MSWQQETNMVFEWGSNMISAGLCEINLAAMQMIVWTGRWIKVIKLALRLVRGLRSLCQDGGERRSQKQETFLFAKLSKKTKQV